MKFSNPAFLWALFSLAIPVIIHLFHFRRFKTVYFTNVRFLRELKEETQSRSRLKHFLVLIARCLAITALVLAFAQPFIPAGNQAQKSNRLISIYIDNSFSMDGRGETASLLELARNHAAEIVQSYKDTDKFHLITGDFEGRHQRILSKEQILERIQEVKISPASRPLSEVYRRQKDMLRELPGSQGKLYWISDFQQSQSALQGISPDSLIAVNCVFLKSQTAANVAIDSIYFESPFRKASEAELLQVRLRNTANAAVEDMPVQVFLNAQQKGIGSFRAGPDSSLTLAIPYSATAKGFQSGVVKINDYPLVFDDQFFFSYPIPDKVRILVLNGKAENPYLKRLFAGDPAFEFQQSTALQVDYASLSRQNFIILNEIDTYASGLLAELRKCLDRGAHLLILPSLQTDLSNAELLASTLSVARYTGKSNTIQRVGDFNYRHSIYDDVFEKNPENIDLPQVKEFLNMQATAGSREEAIMKLQNGASFLSAFDVGKGRVYQLATPLQESASNFPVHALFIPTLYKMALYSVPPATLYYELGGNQAIELEGIVLRNEQPVRMIAEDGGLEIIPQQVPAEGKLILNPGPQLQTAGNYKIVSGDSILALVSFNYPRRESEAAFLSEERLKSELEQLGLNTVNILDGNQKELRQAVLQLDEGKPLWKIFIVATLIFLLTEILLIRFLKS